MKLQDELPVDHRLAQVYRYGAALSGIILLVFGILGFANRLAFFDTTGVEIAGLSSNGLLSLISVVVGALLIAGAVVGGNTASDLNMAIGLLFLLSGFFHLAVLDLPVNILAFRMPNVIFSFAMGLLILTFGMYGRVSGGLPHDNPYWRRRHPDELAREEERRRRAAARARVLNTGRRARPRRLEPVRAERGRRARRGGRQVLR